MLWGSRGYPMCKSHSEAVTSYTLTLRLRKVKRYNKKRGLQSPEVHETSFSVFGFCEGPLVGRCLVITGH